MTCHCSKPIVICPIPVSISLVVICDIRALVCETEDGYHFPYQYLDGKVVAQFMATKVLGLYTHVLHPCDNWLPVDIRSRSTRRNIDDQYSLDIGYMTILDEPDLPLLSGDDLKWELVNLDDSSFPLPLLSDHNSLWSAAREMFSIIK